MTSWTSGPVALALLFLAALLSVAATPASPQLVRRCLPAIELSDDLDLVFSAAFELGAAFRALGLAQLRRGCTLEGVAALQMAIIFDSTPRGPSRNTSVWNRMLVSLARAQTQLRDETAGGRVAGADSSAAVAAAAAGTDAAPRSPPDATATGSAASLSYINHPTARPTPPAAAAAAAAAAAGRPLLSSQGPPRGEDHDGVAIVSLCEYDPARTNLTALSHVNKARYAARHGYPLFMHTQRLDSSRPAAWSKLLLVRKYLPYFDWVMWMDCDSFFQNQTMRLDGGGPHEGQDENPLLDDRYDVVISADGVMVNTGVFFVRRSAWSFDFLGRVYGTKESPFINHPWWEQAAMHFALRHNRTAAASAVRHVKFVPQSEINSYPEGIAVQWKPPDDDRAGVASSSAGAPPSPPPPLHAPFRWGQRIISFSGCKVYFSPAQCEAFYERFAVGLPRGHDDPLFGHGAATATTTLEVEEGGEAPPAIRITSPVDGDTLTQAAAQAIHIGVDIKEFRVPGDGALCLRWNNNSFCTVDCPSCLLLTDVIPGQHTLELKLMVSGPGAPPGEIGATARVVARSPTLHFTVTNADGEKDDERGGNTTSSKTTANGVSVAAAVSAPAARAPPAVRPPPHPQGATPSQNDDEDRLQPASSCSVSGEDGHSCPVAQSGNGTGREVPPLGPPTATAAVIPPPAETTTRHSLPPPATRDLFNISQCQRQVLGIYIYPATAAAGHVTAPYLQILRRIRSVFGHQQPRQHQRQYRGGHARPEAVDATSVARLEVTANPAEACLFIPSVDTLCLYNRCASDGGKRVEERLRMMPYWRGGRNHVIFYMSDHAPPFDPGQAVLARSSVAIGSHRTEFDVTVPLSFYRCFSDTPFRHLTRYSMQGGASNASGASSAAGSVDEPRRYLLTFKGAVYSLVDSPAAVRRVLLELDNGDDIIVEPYCTWTSQNCQTGEQVQWTISPMTSWCAALMAARHRSAVVADSGPTAAVAAAAAAAAAAASPEETLDMMSQSIVSRVPIDYDQLMLDADFVLVPPGEGYHSYRILEALQAGAIPVILGDMALPLQEHHDVDWSLFSVRVTSDRPVILGLPEKLRSISPVERSAMREEGRRVFQSHFSSLRAHVRSTLEAIAQQIRQRHA